MHSLLQFNGSKVMWTGPPNITSRTLCPQYRNNSRKLFSDDGNTHTTWTGIWTHIRRYDNINGSLKTMHSESKYTHKNIIQRIHAKCSYRSVNVSETSTSTIHLTHVRAKLHFSVILFIHSFIPLTFFVCEQNIFHAEQLHTHRQHCHIIFFMGLNLLQNSTMYHWWLPNWSSSDAITFINNIRILETKSSALG